MQYPLLTIQGAAGADLSISRSSLALRNLPLSPGHLWVPAVSWNDSLYGDGAGPPCQHHIFIRSSRCGNGATAEPKGLWAERKYAR